MSAGLSGDRDVSLQGFKRRDWERLGMLMLPVEMGGKMTLTPQLAERALAAGLIERKRYEIYGKPGRSAVSRLPIVVEGWVLSPRGHILWCEWCAEHYDDEGNYHRVTPLAGAAKASARRKLSSMSQK